VKDSSRGRAANAAALPLLVALLVCGAGPVLADVEIWSRQDEFVRIERQDDANTPGNEHPVQLAPGEIAAVLSLLRVHATEEADPVPVFSSQEVALLGETLSQGLARAEPGEDISFTTIGSHRAGRVVGRRLVNTGRVFYRDGRLNVLFGEVHGEYRKRNLYGQRDQDYRPRRHASRTTPAGAAWRLESAPGVDRPVQAGRERPDWLSIDVGRVLASADAPVQAPHGRAAPEEPVAATEAHPGTVEARLAALKDLYDKGLIPDEIYHSRVEAILDEL
jgi:hypothetical protein